MQTYAINAQRIDQDGSAATVKSASLVLDTSLGGRPDAFNPVELLLASLAACMIKGIERACPLIHFEFSGVEVRLQAIRQDAPPLISSISYELIVDTEEPERRLELLHTNLRKYGTVSNTLAAATALTGSIRRR